MCAVSIPFIVTLFAVRFTKLVSIETSVIINGFKFGIPRIFSPKIHLKCNEKNNVNVCRQKTQMKKVLKRIFPHTRGTLLDTYMIQVCYN